MFEIKSLVYTISGESIPKLLDKIQHASVVMMDRWSIEVKNNPLPEDQLPHPKVPILNFTYIINLLL